MNRTKFVLLLALAVVTLWASSVLAASSKTCLSSAARVIHVVDVKDSTCGTFSCQTVEGGGCFGDPIMLPYECFEKNATVTYRKCTFTVNANGQATCSVASTPLTGPSSKQERCP